MKITKGNADLMYKDVGIYFPNRKSKLSFNPSTFFGRKGGNNSMERLHRISLWQRNEGISFKGWEWG